MEIDVTAFFENAGPFEFSHSRAEPTPARKHGQTQRRRRNARRF